MKKTALIMAIALFASIAFAEDPFSSGLDAYARSDWSSAMLSFRKATLSGNTAEPWYWLIMSEISAEDYETALKDIDRFTASFPSDSRISDTLYQKGRVQYLLGQYEQSINTLYRFISSNSGHDMIPSAYYWIGESLYSVGRFEESKIIFSLVLEKYPLAIKREAALYRIALIDQTTKEDELLKLLKISHEESLKIIEDYQRREKTYEQAITAYQKRIADMLKDTRIGDLERQLGEEKTKTLALESRIKDLEAGKASQSAQPTAVAPSVPVDDSRKRAIEELKEKAQVLQDTYDEKSPGGK